MEPLTFLLAVLAAGAVANRQPTVNAPVKNVYKDLKALVMHRLAGDPTIETVLMKYENNPLAWEPTLKSLFIQGHLDQDTEVVATAQKFLDLIQLQQMNAPQYHTQVTGNVQGMAKGNYQKVEMNFRE